MNWLKMPALRISIFMIGIASPILVNAQQSEPVFRVDAVSPTKDKPQCKLWYTAGTWWALMPGNQTASLWQRTEDGWKEHAYLRHQLAYTTGHADVWPEGDSIHAVMVNDSILTVVVLTYQPKKNTWALRKKTNLSTGKNKMVVETSTIVRDGAGRYWVAADAGGQILSWHTDKDVWKGPWEIASGFSDDDICTLAVMPGSVLVAWSDQVSDAVLYREHFNQDAFDNWSAVGVIEQGNRTADDHLHAVTDKEGRVYITTKNSVDKIGQPQLVLRVRTPAAVWLNFPYAIKDSLEEPSRPVVVLSSDGTQLLAGHTVYCRPGSSGGYIAFGVIDTSTSEIITGLRKVIQPKIDHNVLINDITVPRHPFPSDGPWIVLASDKQGRVYEADLRVLMSRIGF